MIKKQKINIEKVCTVPVKEYRDKCPIPSKFEIAIFRLKRAKSKEEVEDILRDSNRACELVNCQYLKETKENDQET